MQCWFNLPSALTYTYITVDFYYIAYFVSFSVTVIHIVGCAAVVFDVSVFLFIHFLFLKPSTHLLWIWCYHAEICFQYINYLFLVLFIVICYSFLKKEFCIICKNGHAKTQCFVLSAWKCLHLTITNSTHNSSGALWENENMPVSAERRRRKTTRGRCSVSRFETVQKQQCRKLTPLKIKDTSTMALFFLSFFLTSAFRR